MTKQTSFTFGALKITADEIKAGGKPVATLTPTEILFAFTLAQAGGEILSQGEIIANMYPDRPARALPGPDMADVLICKLRRKIKKVSPGAEQAFETVWNQGYRTSKPKTLKIAI